MLRVEQIKKFMQYRDEVKTKKGTTATALQKLLEDTGTFLYDYADYLRTGKFDEVMSNVKKFNFRECCAYLTFIVRFEQIESEWYDKCVKDGSVYNLLVRLIEVM